MSSSGAAKVAIGAVATEGNKVSTSFHLPTKLTAVRCWQAAVDAAGLDDKVLAAAARISRGHYSKLASGDQGDLLGLAYRVSHTHPDLLRDFISRLAEAETIDPRVVAAEQLASAALRFLRLSALHLQASKTLAKASLDEPVRSAVRA